MSKKKQSPPSPPSPSATSTTIHQDEGFGLSFADLLRKQGLAPPPPIGETCAPRAQAHLIGLPLTALLTTAS